MLIMLIFLVSTASPAFCSENFDFVIIQPGQPGTSQDAQPVMDALARYLQKKLGTGVTIHGRYFNQTEDAAAYLAENQPEWGIVGLGYYLGHAGARCMTPLASTRPGGADSDVWRLVVAKDGPDKWQSLKGAVSGTMLFEPGIAAGLLFDTPAAELPFTLEGTVRPLRALRSVLRGKGGAVVLDKPQYDAVQALSIASGLKVIKTSMALPTSAVVAFGPKQKIHERLSAVLHEMRNDPAAADLLQLLQTEGFGPVDKRLDALKEKNA
jgi:hypothetical protein